MSTHKHPVHPIYIEPEDELTVVIERIQQAPPGRIHLIVPERLSLFQSLLNLKLLAKSATAQQTLIIVSTDPIVQNLAQKLDIPFQETRDSTPEETRTPSPSPEQLPEPVPPAGNWWGTPLPPQHSSTSKTPFFSEEKKTASPSTPSIDEKDEDHVPEKIIENKDHEQTPPTEHHQHEKLKKNPPPDEDDKNHKQQHTKQKHPLGNLFSPLAKENEESGESSRNNFTDDSVDDSVDDKKETSEEIYNHDLEDSPDTLEQKVFVEHISSSSKPWWEDTITGFRHGLHTASTTAIQFFTTSRFVVIGVLGVLLLILASLVLFVPRATITLYPETIAHDREFAIQALEGIDEINYALKQIPATFVEVEEEGSAKAPTTAEKQIGTKATGTISIRNKRSTVELKAGTTITSTRGEGVQFRLSESVTVPGARIGDLGQTIQGWKNDVPVEAVAVGEQGNIQASSFTIAGYEKDNLVTGESSKAFSGGTSRTVKVVAPEDRDKLLQQLNAEVSSKAHNALRSKLAQEWTIPEDTIKTETVEENWSADIGQEAKEVELRLKVRTVGLALRPQDMETLIQRQFTETVPPQFTVIEKSKDWGYEFTAPNYPLKAIDFTGWISTQIVPAYNEKELRKRLFLKSPADVEAVFAQEVPEMQFQQPPAISIWPAAFGRFPILPLNITIEMSEE